MKSWPFDVSSGRYPVTGRTRRFIERVDDCGRAAAAFIAAAVRRIAIAAIWFDQCGVLDLPRDGRYGFIYEPHIGGRFRCPWCETVTPELAAF